MNFNKLSGRSIPGRADSMCRWAGAWPLRGTYDCQWDVLGKWGWRGHKGPDPVGSCWPWQVSFNFILNVVIRKLVEGFEQGSDMT